MDIYIGYRNYKAKVNTLTATGADGGTVNPSNFQAVMAGAIIRFWSSRCSLLIVKGHPQGWPFLLVRRPADTANRGH